MSGASPLVFSAALLLTCALPASAFHFFVRPGTYSCFVEELPYQKSIIHFEYETGTNILTSMINLDVISPKGATIHSATIDKRRGNFQVTTQGIEGPHSVCLTTKGSRSVRVKLQLETHVTGTGEWQEHTDPASGRKFYHNPNTRESVWELPEDVVQSLSVKDVVATSEDAVTTKDEMKVYANYMKALSALMTQIKDESNYMVERQHRFKETSDSTATAVWWMSIVQIALCVLMPTVQTLQMKRLFISKKLV